MTKKTPDVDMDTVLHMHLFLDDLQYQIQDNEDLLEYELATEYTSRAMDLVEEYPKFKDIGQVYIAGMHPGIIGIFLISLKDTMNNEQWAWVIIGDIPPALFSVGAGRNPAQVLDAYLGEMAEWCDAVREGKPLDGLVPVNAPPTKERADKLYSRLEFIGKRILEEYYQKVLGYDLGYDPNEE